MKTGMIVSSLIAVVAGIGLTTVFVNNASPYVTISDVDKGGQKVHIVGKILPDTLRQNSLAREVSFTLKDDTGTIPVKYVGPPQSNLSHATQVVVIGNKKQGVFEADQMLVKCPSKYESQTKPKV